MIHESINYLELPSRDLEATKAFFQQAFQWQFQDYGPDYCAFTGGGMEGGFFKANQCSSSHTGAALIVFYSSDLDSTQQKILDAGGSLLKAIFDFPGGHRFHFTEPCGNEFAVWSDCYSQ